MRLTYTDIKKAHFRNIGKAGQYADPTLLEDFQYSLGQRYQSVFGTLDSYITQDTQPITTVATTQYYTYPVGTQSIDSMTLTIGSVQYTLFPIYDQSTWNWYNTLQIQPTAIPQFFFPRRDDFGIWPIPQDAYSVNFQRFLRDRNLLVDDYSTGTVTLTLGSATVTGSSTTFTPAMVGRWFTITDTSVPGQGYWYRVSAYTSATSITLNAVWAAASTSGKSYRIGESPEIPEEGQSILAAGTTADFYSGLRNDATNAVRFDNMFWTGTYTNTSRDIDSKNITSGLIGIYRKYKDRKRDVIVRRQPDILSPTYKIFASSIS